MKGIGFMGSSTSRFIRFLKGIALAVGVLAPGIAAAQTVTTVTGAAPTVNNCFPLGIGINWPPFYGFVYQNVPAFELNAGDNIALDTGLVNNVDVGLQIEMVATTANGGDAPAGAFTTVATNSQVPANPLGDAVVGNFEMQFVAENAFSFPGGGLIIRFSNPSATYQSDTICTQNLVGFTAADASGFFVSRFRDTTDGLPPYDAVAANAIGGFRITNLPPVVPPTPPSPQQIPTLSEWAMITLVMSLGFAGIIGLRLRAK
jgi:hypothetical protein